jgi:hypothetical protein
MNAKTQICDSLSGEPVTSTGDHNTPEENGDSPVASTSSHHRPTPKHIHPFPKAGERKIRETKIQILTDTSVKAEIENKKTKSKKENKQKKKQAL